MLVSALIVNFARYDDFEFPYRGFIVRFDLFWDIQYTNLNLRIF